MSSRYTTPACSACLAKSTTAENVSWHGDLNKRPNQSGNSCESIQIGWLNRVTVRLIRSALCYYQRLLYTECWKSWASSFFSCQIFQRQTFVDLFPLKLTSNLHQIVLSYKILSKATKGFKNQRHLKILNENCMTYLVAILEEMNAK